MLVRPIARIDDIRFDALSEELRRAGGPVTNDDHIDSHRLEVSRRVHERLTLADTRARGCDVHRVRRKSLLGELEGDARARRCFEEEIDDRGSAQRRNLLDRALADLLERLGSIEDETDL